MTIFSIKELPCWLLLFVSCMLFSQNNTTGVWRPIVALNYNVWGDYSHNFALGNQNFVYQNNGLDLTVRQLQFIHFSRYQLTDNQNVSLGLQWRNSKIFEEDNFNEFRITEEYNLRFTPRIVRYSNRIRIEQRLSSLPTVHRFRYRFTADFPLEGDKLDVGESYMLWAVENLLSVGRSRRSLYEIRFRGGVGWRLSQKTNLQFVLDYRLRDYTHQSDHVFLLETLLSFRL